MKCNNNLAYLLLLLKAIVAPILLLPPAAISLTTHGIAIHRYGRRLNLKKPRLPGLTYSFVLRPLACDSA